MSSSFHGGAALFFVVRENFGIAKRKGYELLLERWFALYAPFIMRPLFCPGAAG